MKNIVINKLVLIRNSKIGRSKAKVKCEEVYEQLYHHEPEDVVFCSYRLAYWGHISTTSRARLMGLQ
jgi:hypothetical protein